MFSWSCCRTRSQQRTKDNHCDEEQLEALQALTSCEAATLNSCSQRYSEERSEEQEAKGKTESKKENRFASVHVCGRAELLSAPLWASRWRRGEGCWWTEAASASPPGDTSSNPRHSREAELPAISRNIEHIHLFN